MSGSKTDYRTDSFGKNIGSIEEGIELDGYACAVWMVSSGAGEILDHIVPGSSQGNISGRRPWEYPYEY